METGWDSFCRPLIRTRGPNLQLSLGHCRVCGFGTLNRALHDHHPRCRHPARGAASGCFQITLAYPGHTFGSVRLPRWQRPFDLFAESGHSGSLLSFAFRSGCFVRGSGPQFLDQAGALDRAAESAQRDFHRFIQLEGYSGQFSSWL